MKKYYFVEKNKRDEFIYYTFKNLIDDTLITISYCMSWNYFNVYGLVNNNVIDIFDYIPSKKRLLKKLYKMNIILKY